MIFIYTIDYLIALLPVLMLTIWARARIARAYAAGWRIPAGSAVTGAEAAAIVIREGGVTGVAIEEATGDLADHYDPKGRVLRLSRAVYSGRSLSALGVAAHEAGHAVQHASGYPALVVRNLIVPLAGLGSRVFWLMMTAGFLLGMARLIRWGVILYLVMVAIQLITLPVEFDANRRGLRLLRSTGIMSDQEDEAVSRVMKATAWTYVAATLTGVITIVDDLVALGSLVRRRERE